MVTHLCMDGGEYDTAGNIEILRMRTEFQKIRVKL